MRSVWQRNSPFCIGCYRSPHDPPSRGSCMSKVPPICAFRHVIIVGERRPHAQFSGDEAAGVRQGGLFSPRSFVRADAGACHLFGSWSGRRLLRAFSFGRAFRWFVWRFMSLAVGCLCLFSFGRAFRLFVWRFMSLAVGCLCVLFVCWVEAIIFGVFCYLLH